MIGLPLAKLINIAIELFWIILLVRVILSWMPLGSIRNPTALSLARFTYAVTEPLLAPIRKALRPYMGNMPVDISPIILMLVVGVIQRLL